MHWALLRLPPRQPRDKAIYRFVKNCAGYAPRNLTVYRLAFTHVSVLKNGNARSEESNERLEFLGDAILGSVTAEFLYYKYVRRDEGFLTELRSKIVNRASLNDIAIRLGLDAMLEYDPAGTWMNRSMFGNTLEAFIGALYLDLGYRRARHFIVQRLLAHCVNVETLADTDTNYKSKLMEYAQKNKMNPVRYEVVEERPSGRLREFTVAVKIGQQVLGYGTDTKKKFAEQKASEAALSKLLPGETAGR